MSDTSPQDRPMQVATIDEPLIRKRQTTWKHLHATMGLKEAIELFEDKFNSSPTPEEYRQTKIFTGQQHVYFITDGEYVKIGISIEVRGRLSGLQTANARPLLVAGVIPYGGQDFEAALHKKFAHLRAKGEWFKIAPELKSYIEYVGAVNYETLGRPLSQCVVRIEKNDLQEI